MIVEKGTNLHRVTEALQKGSQEQHMIAAIGLEVVATLLRKNADYGGSVFRPPLLAPMASNTLGIQVRLSDKVERLRNLLATGRAEVQESVMDTLTDLVGYGILWRVSDALQNMDCSGPGSYGSKRSGSGDEAAPEEPAGG
jgi:hypothetical protein